MKVSIAGNDFSFHPGEQVDIDDDLAKKWIEVGHCEQIEGDSGGSKDRNGTKRGTSKSK
jgi:hypothetical protein